jgi:S1-C subfamily serine protease
MVVDDEVEIGATMHHNSMQLALYPVYSSVTAHCVPHLSTCGTLPVAGLEAMTIQSAPHAAHPVRQCMQLTARLRESTAVPRLLASRTQQCSTSQMAGSLQNRATSPMQMSCERNVCSRAVDACCPPAAAAAEAPRSRVLRTAGAAMLGVLTSVQLPADAAIVEEDVAERVYDAAAPSVVAIHTRSKQNSGEEGLGSGIVWDRLGHLVTNYHVVQVRQT